MISFRSIHELFFQLTSFLKRHRKPLQISFGALLIILGLTHYFFFSAPRTFKPDTLLKIKAGLSVGEVANLLKEKGLIRSEIAFKAFMRLPIIGTEVIAGDYSFDKPLPVFILARRVSHGLFDLEMIKVTVLEGTSVNGVSAVLDKNLKFFDREVFFNLASSSEGYLFPDTYLLSPIASEEEIKKIMEDNLFKKMLSLKSKIILSGRTNHEILTMASLLEKEASIYEDRQLIAGILWKRLDEDMLLQVDAVFPYFLPRNTFTVTKKDLKYDSPYNTYKYKGLPPTPITNPGLEAIKAAIDYTPSDYYYYLADGDGVTHYAETYKEHLANARKYLK